MRRFKGLFAVLAIALVGLTMVACKPKEFTAHVFFWNNADPFVGEIRASLTKQFNDKEIKFIFHDGKNDIKTQTDQITTAIAQNADILVLNLVDSTLGQTVLDQAKAKNIPTVFFNRQPEHKIFDGVTDSVLIDGDMIGGAKAQGKMIADYFLADWDKLVPDGTIDYLMIRAEQGHEAANARTKYAVEEANIHLKAAGKPELRRHEKAPSDLLADDWSAQKGKAAMDTFTALITTANLDSLDLVIGNNDGIAEGVIESLNTNNYNTGSKETNYIPVFGYDATTTGKNLVKANKLSGTILQDALANATLIANITNNVKNGLASTEWLTGTDYKYNGTFNRVVVVDAAYDPEIHG